MDLSDRVLGQSVTKHLRERAVAPLLKIGRDVFTRRVLAKVDCFNFIAAANLSHILNDELQVKDTREVYEKISPLALVLPRLGSISLAVLGAAFEEKGLGGDAPLENWVRKHQPKDRKDQFVTFDTLKHKSLTARRDRGPRHVKKARASSPPPPPSSSEE